MAQGLAGQMQGICKGAGAPVLELILPEQEQEEEQQENMNPNGKQAGVKSKPEQEVGPLHTLSTPNKNRQCLRCVVQQQSSIERWRALCLYAMLGSLMLCWVSLMLC